MRICSRRPGRRETCRVVVGTQDAGFAAEADAVDAATVAAAQSDVHGGDDGLMLYTSGTTAHPKGCVHSHAAIMAEGERIAERLDLGPDDRFWTPLPFFHVGSIAILAGALAASCASLQMAHFEPTAALDQLEEERCTVAFPAFETIWLGVLNHPRFASADLSRIRLVIAVGVPPSLVSMQERFPSATLISCFGSTETCAFACLGEAHHPLEARSTTSGLPLRDIEIRTIDPETGADVPAGQPGELIMRGPTRFLRYHDDPEQTALTIDEDGWYHSGDLGRLDERRPCLLRRAPQGHAQGGRRERRRGRDRGVPRHPPRVRDRAGRGRPRRPLRRGGGGVRAAQGRRRPPPSRS